MTKKKVYKNIKLYYIHGYLSSPDSTKGTLLKKTLNAIPIKYRDCPPEKLKISECLENIKKVIENDLKSILIGSSLGGYLAAKTAQMNNNVKKLILLNPAIIPPDYDITKIKDMPQEILQNLQDSELFNLKISADITILIGKQDDVIPNSWPIKFGNKHKALIEFYEDDHSFSKNLEKLPKIIKEIIE